MPDMLCIDFILVTYHALHTMIYRRRRRRGGGWGSRWRRWNGRTDNEEVRYCCAEKNIAVYPCLLIRNLWVNVCFQGGFWLICLKLLPNLSKCVLYEDSRRHRMCWITDLVWKYNKGNYFNFFKLVVAVLLLWVFNW